MTTINPSAVATMQGRELDAAVAFRVTKWKSGCSAVCPYYSTDPSAFFAMVEAVQKAGWTVEIIENLSPDESDWLARLTFCHGGQYSQRESGGDTMSLAFARAALLACLTEPAK